MLHRNINTSVNTKEISMLTALFGWIKSLIQERSYQDSVEYYVASKHPTTTAEVEYWIREYDTHKKAWSLWKSLHKQFGTFL